MLLCHSTLSYGAASKSWTVTNSIKYSLQTFNHCSLHSILNINMYEVEEQWISHQCQDLKNVPTSKTSLSSSQEKKCHKQTTTLSSCHLGLKPKKKGVPTSKSVQHHDKLTTPTTSSSRSSL
jgi:hypothetical protein